jgi:predicted nuclease of restriction endonuclease-like (RecB) superfamily
MGKKEEKGEALTESGDYRSLLKEIKQRVYQAQYEALRAVNKELIALYWDIGRSIVERQKKHGWGKSVVETLARDLQLEFPGMQGFSIQNLWYMRQFYLEYSTSEKLQPLVGEISWAKHLVIMARCKDGLEREFYIQMTRKYGWTKNVLILHIENDTYGKTLRNQTNFSKTLPEDIRNQAKLAVKDEYTFGFLELEEEHSEREFEKAVMRRMDNFLREMGGAIAFVGSQYRLEVGGQEFYVDILLYHRHLRCFIALELKVGDFMPEYVGKMQFYLAVLDDKVCFKEENPSIGIIVCKSKNRTIVEYALKETNKPIGVATYRITNKPPKDLRKALPGPELIGRLIEG